MMTKKSYSYDKFFVSNRNFTSEHVKILKKSELFQVFAVFFSKF